MLKEMAFCLCLAYIYITFFKILTKTYRLKDQNYYEQNYNVHQLVCLIEFRRLLFKKEEKEEGFKFSVTSPLRKDTLVVRDYVWSNPAIQHIEVRAAGERIFQNIFC